jgi:hypothetical protein
LTMDFCCASHVDTNDTTRVSWTQREVVSRLQNVCNGFRNLRDEGVACTEMRALQVVEALKHVAWWGIYQLLLLAATSIYFKNQLVQ